MRGVRGLLNDIYLGLIQNMPGILGFRLRYSYWKVRFKSLGKNVRIDGGVYFQGGKSISIGDNCWIDRGVTILAGRDETTRARKYNAVRSQCQDGEVIIGNNVHIGPYSIISGIECGIYIGNDCGFSSGVKAYSFSHHFRFDKDRENRSCSFGPMVESERQSLICGPITLEANVGVALNAVILPGVWVGRDSFVGIGSVVMTGEYEENSILVGTPAKRIGGRFL